MSHEITSTDRVLVHKTQAWHGLGIVVQHAATPTEALELAGLGWEVEQWPISTTNGEIRQTVESHVMNVRADTREQLGIVGKDYQPIQNIELASFCEALAKEDDKVTVESAGSIRGGKRLWFLLKGESFSVRGEDQVDPYICVSNGHDGGAAMRVTPTTVRVVCSNTLHMVIPDAEGKSSSRYKTRSMSIRHTGNVEDKIAEARRALALYEHAADSTRDKMIGLAAQDVNSEDVKAFWLGVYERQMGAIKVDPETDAEKRALDRATTAVAKMGGRPDAEKAVAGTTAWNAMNAYTGWIQHDRGTIKDADRRAAAVLIGEAGDRSADAMDFALKTLL